MEESRESERVIMRASEGSVRGMRYDVAWLYIYGDFLA